MHNAQCTIAPGLTPFATVMSPLQGCKTLNSHAISLRVHTLG